MKASLRDSESLKEAFTARLIQSNMPKTGKFCDIMSLVDGNQPGQPRFLSSRHQHLTLRRRPSPRCATFPLVTAVTNGRLGTLSVSNASFGTSPPDNKLRGIGF